MKRSAGQKVRRPLNGSIYTSLISMLGFFIFSTPGYGSTYIPANVAAAPVTIEEAALFAGLGAEPVLASLEVFAAVNGEVGSAAVSTLLAELQDGEAVHTDMPFDLELLNGPALTALPCQGSCPL